ncbi:MAG TPA: cytochrome c oxidase subunit 3 [Chitinophagales bacterium]|nr:cytochrome c oxidase subunit 3 [Chitinophagales bacterium]
MSEQDVIKEKTEYNGVHPQKLALWVAMASMSMFFAALTSALLVKKGDYRVWENFKLPAIFMFSTLSVIAVSVCIHAALISYRKAKFVQFRWLMFFSFILGCLFLVLQLGGWNVMINGGMTLTENLSGAFIYVITASHGVHIIVGLLVMLVFIINAFRNRKDPIYELRSIINPKRQLHLELLVSYWHYVDAVWVYLYVFFYLNYR